MAHTKIITPGAQDFGEPTVQMVKLSSRGLVGKDLDDFIKRASVQFLDKLAGIKFLPGEVPVHLIAVGATEFYGPNRNGDGFRASTCRECHPSFQKYARWYRDHLNKEPREGRGIVKASAYNGDMHRIELLVALNGTKEAADRNRGLVADEEIEKLARGEQLATSMACRVPHDVCSGCGNKAKTRAEYCDESMCKYGGCKHNLAKTFDDGHTLHVDNPNPVFFDISRVFRPADRIAYTLGRAKVAAAYDEMLKAAADNEFGAEKRGSAALAEKLGIAPPLWLLTDGPWCDPKIVGQLKVANSLIQIEEACVKQAAPQPHDRAFGEPVQPICRDLPDVRHGPYKLAHVLSALSAAKCMLPVEAFVSLLSGEYTQKTAAAVEQVRARLPGIYTRLASDPRLEEDLRNNPYVPEGAAPSRIQRWVLKHASEWSLERPRVIERLQLAILRSPGRTVPQRPMMKIATCDSAEELAKQYALYQLGYLYSQANAPDSYFMQNLAVRSNFVR